MTTKNKVLAQLIDVAPDYISGEKIAQNLSISRTAIWKAINELKKEGHQIESSTKKGYSYIPTDILSTEGIQAFLLPEIKNNLDVKVVPSTASTNKDLKLAAIEGEQPPKLLVANQQTATQGRFGRAYFAQAGSGLYFSLLLAPDKQLAEVTQYTLIAAVAICRAVEKLTDKNLVIKWVNDLYINQQKVCGILSEALTNLDTGTISSVIIGMGINVAIKTEDFPEELQSKATSLYPDGQSKVTRNQLVATIVNEFHQIIATLPENSFIDEYRRRSFVIGREIEFVSKGITHTGKAVGIGNTGELIVNLTDGTQTTLSSGEISLTKY